MKLSCFFLHSFHLGEPVIVGCSWERSYYSLFPPFRGKVYVFRRDQRGLKLDYKRLKEFRATCYHRNHGLERVAGGRYSNLLPRSK